ncbi:membrane protein [Companilactobacillus ginsenosidimutans]|uniref:Membrane protein n=2 Tax=Companilactobacillus ginsenosidimutans TaxID=1007676 RepID=A0A0H4QNK9_9LACO|nr:membrane protein [Companilactobacillus ginsenosidimutans]
MLTMSAVPYVTALIASWLGHVSKSMLVSDLGPNSQLAVGGLGVAIHEFGHASFAFLFGHRVTHMQLLNFHYAESGTLGSVEHTWNDHNVYQRLGNFFIGLAPYYMCSIALYLLQKVLLHNTLNFASVLKTTGDFEFNSLSTIVSAVISNFTNVFSNASWPMIILYFVLSVMIASTGYDLSSEDLSTVTKGVTPWMIVLAIVSIVMVFLNLKAQMVSLISVVIVFSLLFLVQALIYILISMVVIKIIGII